jgi:hypothetical protein
VLSEVCALTQAVGLISDEYFEGHHVLFEDTQSLLSSCSETVKSLIVGYNHFARENGADSIDIELNGHDLKDRVEQLLNEWVVLSRSSVLEAQGKIVEARDTVLSFLSASNSHAS